VTKILSMSKEYSKLQQCAWWWAWDLLMLKLEIMLTMLFSTLVTGLDASKVGKLCDKQKLWISSCSSCQNSFLHNLYMIHVEW
jgi:hypothetical protein